MSYTDYRATADEARRNSAKQYYESRRNARRAADQYKIAAREKRYARWLTLHLDAWSFSGTPADREAYADSATRLADTYLRSSFGTMDRARFYTRLARDYDAMAERYRP